MAKLWLVGFSLQLDDSVGTERDWFKLISLPPPSFTSSLLWSVTAVWSVTAEHSSLVRVASGSDKGPENSLVETENL